MPNFYDPRLQYIVAAAVSIAFCAVLVAIGGR